MTLESVVLSDRVPVSGHVWVGAVQLMMGLPMAFNSKSALFRQLQSAYLGSGALFESDEFLNSSEVVRHFQMLMVVLLSLHGGIQCAAIQEFSMKPSGIRLFWENNKYVAFDTGVCSEAFRRFVVDVQRLILKIDRPAPMFLKSDMKAIPMVLAVYTDQLTLLKRNFDKLITAVPDNRFSLKELTQELLFILMGALSIPQINTFFLEIHSFFPPDLEIRLINGTRVNVDRYFEKTSEDISFLIDKIKVFATLFYSQTLPIIREIAQAYGSKAMIKLLESTPSRNEVLKNLSETVSLQMEPRIELFQFIAQHLRALGINE